MTIDERMLDADKLNSTFPKAKRFFLVIPSSGSARITQISWTATRIYGYVNSRSIIVKMYSANLCEYSIVPGIYTSSKCGRKYSLYICTRVSLE